MRIAPPRKPDSCPQALRCSLATMSPPLWQFGYQRRSVSDREYRRYWRIQRSGVEHLLERFGLAHRFPEFEQRVAEGRGRRVL
jgi:hypothetical protein